jgi:hypothetical protein
MTTSTISNSHMQRKTLSTQIDRLDSMLDGLAENLNDAVAMAVKETVAQVVRGAVEVAVKEVLSNPELLRAVLAQHVPPPAQIQPTPKAQRRSFTEAIKSGWSWVCRKVTQTATHIRKKLGQGLSFCVEKAHKAWSALWGRRSRWIASGVGALTALGTAGLTLWHYRRSCSIALTAGLIAGVCSYCIGPLLSAMLCGLGGMTITLSTLIGLPLGNLLFAGNLTSSSE